MIEFDTWFADFSRNLWEMRRLKPTDMECVEMYYSLGYVPSEAAYKYQFWF
jgi:hypothetical protein